MSIKRKILKNIATLSVSEMINKGVVLITSLYLMRQVTPEGTGVINFADAFASFFILIVTLAFSQIGSREIAKKSFDIPKIVNTIITSRILLCVLSAVLYVITLYFIGLDTETKSVTYVYLGLLVMNALNLDWAFQGMEKMGIMASRQVMTSTLTLLGFLVFVHGREDVMNAAIITVSSAILNALLLFFYYNKREYKFSFEIDKAVFAIILKSIVPLSVYIFSIALLNRANILLMEYNAISKNDIGIFVGAFKFIAFGIVPSNIVQMSFFQLLSRTEDKGERMKVYHKYYTLNLLIGSFVYMMLWLFPDVIILALKEEYAASMPLLKIFVISGLIMYMNTGVTPALVAWGYEKKVMNATLLGGFVSFLANIFLIKYYGIYGAVYASIIGEAFITMLYMRYLTQVLEYKFLKPVSKVFAVLFTTTGIGILLKYIELNVFVVLAIVPILFFVFAILFKITNKEELLGLIKR